MVEANKTTVDQISTIANKTKETSAEEDFNKSTPKQAATHAISQRQGV
jgi:hypothetical protein